MRCPCVLPRLGGTSGCPVCTPCTPRVGVQLQHGVGGRWWQGLTLRGMNTSPTTVDLANAAAAVAQAQAAATTAYAAAVAQAQAYRGNGGSGARFNAADAAAKYADEAAAMYERAKEERQDAERAERAAAMYKRAKERAKARK